MLHKNENLNGLILAGGNSSRMGHDKSEIHYYGKPQYQVLYNQLTLYCNNVFLSRRSDQIKPATISVIEDQLDIRGPLNGILTAFTYAPHTAWISVPCDMPLIDPSVLSFLIDNRNKNKVATCFWDSEKKYPEPLLTIWEKEARSLLTDFYKQGGVSPRRFLLENDIHIIQAPDSRKLLNINTAEELTQLLSESKA